VVVNLRNTSVTVRGVRGLGIRMSTLDTTTSLYTEDRRFQVYLPDFGDHVGREREKKKQKK